jgi:hypothetical protein
MLIVTMIDIPDAQAVGLRDKRRRPQTSGAFALPTPPQPTSPPCQYHIAVPTVRRTGLKSLFGQDPRVRSLEPGWPALFQRVTITLCSPSLILL